MKSGIIRGAAVIILTVSIAHCDPADETENKGNNEETDTDTDTFTDLVISTDSAIESDSETDSNTDCYSPFQNYSNAYEEDMVGCKCSEEGQGVCIGGAALICENGQWIAVEDGPCMPQTDESCVKTLDDLSTCLASFKTCIVEVDGSICARDPKSETEAVCTHGQDQTCNDSPTISSLHGKCNEDGTCTCLDGFEKNPETGKCL